MTRYMALSLAESFLVQRALNDLYRRFETLKNQVRGNTPSGWTPRELEFATDQVVSLTSRVNYQEKNEQGISNEIDDALLPMLRLAIELYLEKTVADQEATATVTHSDEPQQTLQASLDMGRKLLNDPGLADVVAANSLSLDRYLNLEAVTRIHGAEARLEPRIIDDKFHTLLSPSLFLKDLQYFRQQCQMRMRPVSVGFIDIDNFKQFNNSLPGQETQVDRDILPPFMTALEAFAFGRASAYRQGGDEYLMVLPGATGPESLHFFDRLRLHLSQIQYAVSCPPLTVSIGVCTASAADRLTARQIQEFSNIAKQYAKSQGRNRVAGYVDGAPHSNSSLMIFS